MITMKNRSTCFNILIIAVVITIFTGCAGTSKPSTFYLLSSLPESEHSIQATADNGALSVLIGPITLPAYLDRNQVVTVAGSHELVLDEFVRWAEPLQDTLYRVLSENLSLLLKTPKVYAYNSRGSKPVDFRITIDITRFDSSAGGDAYLNAFWTVAGRDSKTDLITQKSFFRVAASSKSTSGVLDAQNRALTDLSREIATAIQSLQR